jgi:hypothetical protein
LGEITETCPEGLLADGEDAEILGAGAEAEFGDWTGTDETEEAEALGDAAGSVPP